MLIIQVYVADRCNYVVPSILSMVYVVVEEGYVLVIQVYVADRGSYVVLIILSKVLAVDMIVYVVRECLGSIREALSSIRERLKPIREPSIYASRKLHYTRGFTPDTRETEAYTRASYFSQLGIPGTAPLLGDNLFCLHCS